MNTILTVFKKELLDTIRDRRTLMFMIVIPVLLFPILFKIMFSVQETQTKKAEGKQLYVGVEFLGLEMSGEGREKLRRIINIVSEYEKQSPTPKQTDES